MLFFVVWLLSFLGCWVVVCLFVCLFGLFCLFVCLFVCLWFVCLLFGVVVVVVVAAGAGCEVFFTFFSPKTCLGT